MHRRVSEQTAVVAVAWAPEHSKRNAQNMLKLLDRWWRDAASAGGGTTGSVCRLLQLDEQLCHRGLAGAELGAAGCSFPDATALAQGGTRRRGLASAELDGAASRTRAAQQRWARWRVPHRPLAATGVPHRPLAAQGEQRRASKLTMTTGLNRIQDPNKI